MKCNKMELNELVFITLKLILVKRCNKDEFKSLKNLYNNKKECKQNNTYRKRKLQMIPRKFNNNKKQLKNNFYFKKF